MVVDLVLNSSEFKINSRELLALQRKLSLHLLLYCSLLHRFGRIVDLPDLQSDG